ncbi:hypothetical protein BDN72DRAFT_958361 [Pluteus cervinus]|uniref:Uncharacterized protein n=1 Tax=Pluteus cervinus TaxID=181527 RepID=A0ACD3AZC9_9AGAR|nr:hypothetical protein BDN72DRAFT_958361 [Pluteus cervinus]
MGSNTNCNIVLPSFRELILSMPNDQVAIYPLVPQKQRVRRWCPFACRPQDIPPDYGPWSPLPLSTASPTTYANAYHTWVGPALFQHLEESTVGPVLTTPPEAIATTTSRRSTHTREPVFYKLTWEEMEHRRVALKARDGISLSDRNFLIKSAELPVTIGGDDLSTTFESFPHIENVGGEVWERAEEDEMDEEHSDGLNMTSVRCVRFTIDREDVSTFQHQGDGSLEVPFGTLDEPLETVRTQPPNETQQKATPLDEGGSADHAEAVDPNNGSHDDSDVETSEDHNERLGEVGLTFCRFTVARSSRTYRERKRRYGYGW